MFLDDRIRNVTRNYDRNGITESDSATWRSESEPGIGNIAGEAEEEWARTEPCTRRECLHCNGYALALSRGVAAGAG